MNSYESPDSHQNIETILLEKLQGFYLMVISTALADYKTTNSSEAPSWHQNLETPHKKIAKDIPNGTLFPLGQLLFIQQNKYSKYQPSNIDGPSFDSCNINTAFLKRQ